MRGVFVGGHARLTMPPLCVCEEGGPVMSCLAGAPEPVKA